MEKIFISSERLEEFEWNFQERFGLWKYFLKVTKKLGLHKKTENFDFLNQICPKRTFPVEKSKIENHHWILHIRISLGTKFHLKLTSLISWYRSAQKGYYWPKMEKVNITIAFYISKLVWVPN